jgi:hypothetical protein
MNVITSSPVGLICQTFPHVCVVATCIFKKLQVGGGIGTNVGVSYFISFAYSTPFVRSRRSARQLSRSSACAAVSRDRWPPGPFAAAVPIVCVALLVLPWLCTVSTALVSHALPLHQHHRGCATAAVPCPDSPCSTLGTPACRLRAFPPVSACSMPVCTCDEPVTSLQFSSSISVARRPMKVSSVATDSSFQLRWHYTGHRARGSAAARPYHL